MNTPIFCLSAALLFFEATGPVARLQAAEPTVEGTWRWKFAMPDGSIANPTLRLSYEEDQLTGTSSFRAGSEVPVTNLVVRGDELRFQVVRERDGQPIVTTYTGKWSGKTIKGKIDSNWSGEPQTYDWQAEKLHGPDGTWKWTLLSGERKIESQVTLKQKESRLEGFIAGRVRGARPTRIKNGSIDDDGQLSFEIETGTEPNRRLTEYKGKLTVDTITGTIETTVNGAVRKSDWVARRAY